MRMFKLALIALAALLLGGASASAITVKKRTEAPGLPPEIWAIRRQAYAISSRTALFGGSTARNFSR